MHEWKLTPEKWVEMIPEHKALMMAFLSRKYREEAAATRRARHRGKGG